MALCLLSEVLNPHILGGRSLLKQLVVSVEVLVVEIFVNPDLGRLVALVLLHGLLFCGLVVGCSDKIAIPISEPNLADLLLEMRPQLHSIICLL